MYFSASPLSFKIGALIAGSPEPLDVKSTSSVVSNTISLSTLEAICNPLSIGDGASPYNGWPVVPSALIVVSTFNFTTDGVVFGDLYPRNSDNLRTFLFSVAVVKIFSWMMAHAD